MSTEPQTQPAPRPQAPRRPLLDPRLVALLLPVMPMLWLRMRTLLMIGGGLFVVGMTLSPLDIARLVLVVVLVLAGEAVGAIPTTVFRRPSGGAR